MVTPVPMLMLGLVIIATLAARCSAICSIPDAPPQKMFDAGEQIVFTAGSLFKSSRNVTRWRSGDIICRCSNAHCAPNLRDLT